MVLTALITSMALASASCTSHKMGSNVHELVGQYKVIPVDPEFQEKMMDRLKDKYFEKIDRDIAQELSNRNKLSSSMYYYLAKAGAIVGKNRKASDMARFFQKDPMSLALAVDSEGVGYLISFMLTDLEGASSFSVILISQTKLTTVFPICMAVK